MNKYNPDGELVIEQSFLRVPHEQVKKSYRMSQKHIEKDLAFVTSSMDDMVKRSKAQNLDSDTTQRVVENMLKRLENLKRKLQDTKNDETQLIQRSKQRATHLNTLYGFTSYTSEEYREWSRTRLNRILVDYMLRKGYSRTAAQLVERANLESLADTELFEQSAVIEQSLLNHSCTKGIQWCSDNKSALRKLKSTLEFDLHLQEFIELARAGEMMQAIQYSKKHLLPWTGTHARQIEQAMGLLAFKPDTQCSPYQQLYDTNRWQQLVDHFRKDNYALHALSTVPPLLLTLQTGLSALKNVHCYHADDRNINCPVCQTDTLGELAKSLPYSHHINSNLVCRVTGLLMNEDNPPMKLPNGRVYSLTAISQMAAENRGRIQCPMTGETFALNEAKKLFIS
ncbi:GID complex subunit containing RING finger motif [Dispira parvispora]|uniref:GID complex subunit containing RING finger motif n=1 Tax=Dispira parvispora TaxID=1520584 RepID=A0A9W8E8J3_9FUNG|nr:GID complex subunit containing RING finger motif [Dispira parvispora]